MLNSCAMRGVVEEDACSLVSWLSSSSFRKSVESQNMSDLET